MVTNFNKDMELNTVWEAIETAKIKLNEIQSHKTEAAIFRSKAQWVREGECNSKYFFNLERRRYLEKNMKAVFNAEGNLLTNQQAILDEQTKFYKDLYTTNNQVQFGLSSDLFDLKLSEIDHQNNGAQITMSEIYDGMMTLKRNKTPGADGLTIEFYHIFWDCLSTILFEMYEFSFERNLLPLSTRRGVISLLPKGNKDTRWVQNMRPLTLLNNDYKILAKTLDNRLKLLIPKIVKNDQTGFIKGRNISMNVRKSLDVIQYCSEKDIPAVILSVDMAKCFDRLEHRSLFECMRLFNFNDRFIRWISLFFQDFQVATQNFGSLSDWFVKSRGINQGVPCLSWSISCSR